jgi:hypothetical protein
MEGRGVGKQVDVLANAWMTAFNSLKKPALFVIESLHLSLTHRCLSACSQLEAHARLETSILVS